MREALIERGVVSEREIEDRVERCTRAGRCSAGGSSRAWSDPAYKRRLLEDGSAVLRELLGIDIGAPPTLPCARTTAPPTCATSPLSFHATR